MIEELVIMYRINQILEQFGYDIEILSSEVVAFMNNFPLTTLHIIRGRSTNGQYRIVTMRGKL